MELNIKLEKEYFNELSTLFNEVRLNIKNIFKALKSYHKDLDKEEIYDAMNDLSEIDGLFKRTIDKLKVEIPKIDSKYSSILNFEYEKFRRNNKNVDVKGLIDEKEKLLKRLNEIEEILKQIK